MTHNRLEELLNRKPKRWLNLSIKTFEQDLKLLTDTIREQQAQINQQETSKHREDFQYNPMLTMQRFREATKHIPGHVPINVLNEQGQSTANINVWFENCGHRQFVELMGFKPFYDMTDDEKERCKKEEH